jgi:hypothetical protein
VRLFGRELAGVFTEQREKARGYAGARITPVKYDSMPALATEARR